MTSDATSCAWCTRLSSEPPLYSDSHFDVRGIDGTVGVAGWVVLSTRRHVQSLALLDDHEAQRLGLAIRHIHTLLLQRTGAERVYMAALGEAVQHVHIHFVPRTELATKGFALFATQTAARDGQLVIDSHEHTRVLNSLAAALASAPLPP